MLTLSVRKLPLWLFSIALIFVPLHLYTRPIRRFVEHTFPYQIQVDRLLHLGGEGSLAAWYATALFLLCCAVLWLMLRTTAQRRLVGGLLAGGLLLALDQSILLHERLLAMWATLGGGLPHWLPLGVALVLLWPLVYTRDWAEAARPAYRLGWDLIFAGYGWTILHALALLPESADAALGVLLRMTGAICLLAALLRHVAATTPDVALMLRSDRGLWVGLAGLSVVFSILTAGFYVLASRADLNTLDPFRLLYLLDSGQEATIPTFFAEMLWLWCAALLGLIAVGRRADGAQEARRWRLLAVVFVFLALDETASLHEQIIGVSRAVVAWLNLDTLGVFYHAWVIPVGLLTLGLFVLYLPFLRRLPRSTLLGILFSGALFVAGALGLEMVGGAVVTFAKANDPLRLGVETVEELFEMLGLVTFIAVLRAYLAQYVAPVRIRVVDATAAEQPAAEFGAWLHSLLGRLRAHGRH